MGRSRVLRVVLPAALALSIATVGLAADVPVKVYINGTLQSYSPPAVMRDGTAYVPLRAGAESLGLTVKWEESTKTAHLCTDIGCTFIRQSEGITVNGRLLLPLRRMAEVTGAMIRWDAQQRAVLITG